MELKWETDKDKMDFSKLRWFPEELLFKPFQIEYVPTANLLHKLYPDLFNNRDNEMNNLIDFANTGVKIIPPSFIRMPKLLLSREKKNNIITETFTKQGLCIHDGCHRVSLAKGVGLTEIPILIFDFDADCNRSIMNWVAREGYEWEKHRDNTGTKNICIQYFYQNMEYLIK
jgi:hypothetical protein